MADNNYVIGFEASISGIDTGTLDEAKRILSTELEKDASFKLSLDQASTVAVVRDIKIIGDQLEGIQKLAASIQVGDSLQKVNISAVSDYKTGEFLGYNTVREVQVAGEQVQKEIANLYKEAQRLQGELNKALKAPAEGVAEYYRTEIDKTQAQITRLTEALAVSLAGSDGVISESVTSYIQQFTEIASKGFNAAVKDEGLSEQIGRIKELDAAYRDLYNAYKQLDALPQDTSGYENQINALNNIVQVSQERIQSIIGENSALQNYYKTLEKEGNLQRQLTQAKQQDRAASEEQKRVLDELTKTHEQFLKVSNSEYALSDRLRKNTLARTEASLKLVDAYNDEMSRLQDLIIYLKSYADQIGVGADAERILTEQVNKANIALQEQAALNSKNGSLFENIKKGFKDVVQRVSSYNIAYKAIEAGTRIIRQGIDTVRELDKAFTDIQIVIGGTANEIANLAKEYTNLAKEYGATTVQVTNAATDFLRQGRTLEETNKLIETSLVFSKVGAIDAAAATEYLTSWKCLR